MASRPKKCPDCGARPLPPSTGIRPPARCLACSRDKGGSSWRRYLTRLAERHGKEEAQQIAKAQGVPWRPATTGGPAKLGKVAGGAGGASVGGAGAGSVYDAQRLAIGLHAAHGDLARAAKFAGLEAPSAVLVAEARAFADLVDGKPEGLGRLAYVGLATTLLHVVEHARELAPGAAAQLVKSLRDLWQEVGGGTAHTQITVVWETDE